MPISRRSAERASVSVRLRRHAGAPPLDNAGQPPVPPVRLTREESAAIYGADPGGIGRIMAFANHTSPRRIPRGGNDDGTSRRLCV
jgi:hypothetical protein